MQVLSAADVAAIAQQCPLLGDIRISVGPLSDVAVQASALECMQHLAYLAFLELRVNFLEDLALLPTLAHLTELQLTIRRHKAGATYVEHLPSWVSRMEHLRRLFIDIGSETHNLQLWQPCRDAVGAAVHELINNHLPRSLAFLEVRTVYYAFRGTAKFRADLMPSIK